MDIEELAMILSKNYDEIRDTNTEIENETVALEKETKQQLDNMEKEIQTNIDDMKSQMETLMSDLRKDFKAQADEFYEDIQTDIKALETGDDFEKNVKTDLKTMKKNLQTDILNMRKDLNSVLEEIDKTAANNLSVMRERSEAELEETIHQILTQAKIGEPPKLIKDCEEEGDTQEGEESLPFEAEHIEATGDEALVEAGETEDSAQEWEAGDVIPEVAEVLELDNKDEETLESTESSDEEEADVADESAEPDGELENTNERTETADREKESQSATGDELPDWVGRL